jgi:pimeloyl-[acyl-carrier protein] methyl ester esterase
MKLHVETAGHGPDLVLLHGWGMHSGVWAEVLAPLSRLARVHAIDLPGHGHSAHYPVDRFEDAAEAVAALVPEGAAICGWSLGGLIAQQLAHRHPGRAARLALIATTPCFAARPDWRHGMKDAVLAGFAESLANDRDAMLKRFVALNAMHGPQGREAVRSFTSRLLERGAPSDAGLAASLRWLREIDLREQTARLRLPTIVMHGARDMVAPVAAGRWLAEHLEGARLTELAEAAHMPFFSHREAFLAAMGSLVG